MMERRPNRRASRDPDRTRKPGMGDGVQIWRSLLRVTTTNFMERPIRKVQSQTGWTYCTLLKYGSSVPERSESDRECNAETVGDELWAEGDAGGRDPYDAT